MQEYFVTTVVYERYPVFEDFTAARILVRNLPLLEQELNVKWLAWVVMPNHFHTLLRLEGETGLSEIMRRLKGRSARQLDQHINHAGRFWQPGFYDRALRSEDDRLQIARYIVANPLRAGLVNHIGDYPHWDSVWLTPSSQVGV
jgi:REP element-mobilizing transposase RayT